MQRKKNPVFNLQFTETFGQSKMNDYSQDIDMGDEDIEGNSLSDLHQDDINVKWGWRSIKSDDKNST